MLDYIHKEVSNLKEVDFRLIAESQRLDEAVTKVKRVCYLNLHRDYAVVFDSNSIEFRTTAYSKYSDFMRNLSDVINAFIKVIPAFGKVLIDEVTLSYVDIIVPANNYKLEEFFARGKEALPLNSFGERKGAIALAKNELNEIIDSTHRIFITIEQLPQRIKRFVPDSMVEPEVKFAMPVKLSYEPDGETNAPYAVVSTQASQLHREKMLGNADPFFLFEDSHSHCRSAFKSLINKGVCNEVWDYQS